MSQLTFAMQHQPSYRPDEFLSFAANEAALAKVSSWPEGWGHYALWIAGPEGSGKTHLAHVWRAKASAEFIAASSLQEGWDASLVLEKPEAAWVLDDADSVPHEPAFFHLLNAVRESGGSLLLTAQQPPAAQQQVSLPDLQSRLKAMPVETLERPDDAMLQMLLFKLFSDRQLRIESDVITYLSARMERSYQAAHFWVETLDQAALEQRRKLTVPLVRQVMDNVQGTAPLF